MTSPQDDTPTTPANPVDAATRSQVTLRRAPKFPMFLVVGGLVGLIGTFIATASFPADPQVGFGALFGYFLVYGIPAGVTLGALVGLGVDLISRRRARSVQVEHETIHEDDAPGEVPPVS